MVDFSGADLPKNLQRRYDTLDFGTPVTGFSAGRVNGDTQIVIDASGEVEPLAYQSDNEYVVEVSAAKKPDQNAGLEQKKEYKGERLTLNFQDIETRAVLQLLADASGQNIVVSDTVSGSVTLRLQNVPWDQALDIVLRTKGLDKRQEGNVIIVAPAAELAAREKADLAAKKDIQELEPLHTEYLQVNYAKAVDIANLLRGTSTPGGGGAGGGGSATMRCSRRAVTWRSTTAPTHCCCRTPQRSIADVRRLVATLDIPVRQVLIEARIVVVTNDFERDLGALFGVTATRHNGTNGLFETTGTAAGVDQGVSRQSPISAPTVRSIRYRCRPAPTPPTATTSICRWRRPAGSIALGILGSDYLVDLELDAAQTENRGTVISSPKVITANQREASIKQGIEIPYQQSASSGATTIAFKDAVLRAQGQAADHAGQPHHPRSDGVGRHGRTRWWWPRAASTCPRSTRAPSRRRWCSTDGQTVVLGGILETTHTDAETKVPWLGDIPVLGNLFKNTTKTDDKDELLVFVTPKIIREGVSVN